MSSFIKKIFVQGTIETITGLHISAYNESYELGILDHSVMRDQLTQQPFIPGSTLKGKLRALLEDCHAADGDSSNVETLFGVSRKGTKHQPARILFRDAFLTKESVSVHLPFADLPYTELKKELSVDRTTGRATPLLVERVAAGLFFNMQIIINIYEGDNEANFLNTLFLALDLMQDDYLGGRGSRGYGLVKIHIDSITQKSKESYLQGVSAEASESITIPETLK